MITNKQTTYTLGVIFLIFSFFHNYMDNIICASIFFSVHFIIETLEKNEIEK